MQTIPAGAQLGRTKTGQAIGYRVLRLDRSPYRLFTTEGVSETAIPGHYTALGGVVAPDEGGYIVWGTEAQDYAESTIDAAPVDITERLLAGIAAGLDALRMSIISAMPSTPTIPPFPPVIVNTAEFERGIVTLRAELVEIAQSSNQAHASRVSELQAQIDAVADATQRIQLLTDVVKETEALGQIHSRMSAFFGPTVIHEADPRIDSAIEAFDKFLEKVGGK
jgi:hypothetical protein